MKLYQKLGKTISQESQTDTDNQQSIKNSNELIGIEYIETFYDKKNLPKSYYCKICDCKFSEVKSKDAHLKGKRHRNSYKVKDLSKTIY
jgi:cell division protein FtsI/penicillin-binding protein 2